MKYYFVSRIYILLALISILCRRNIIPYQQNTVTVHVHNSSRQLHYNYVYLKLDKMVDASKLCIRYATRDHFLAKFADISPYFCEISHTIDERDIFLSSSNILKDLPEKMICW